MSAAVQSVGYYGSQPYWDNIGMSTDFGIIQKIFDEISANFQKPVSSGSLTETLNNIYEECSVEDWDGYAAMPVSKAAFFEADKITKLLPSTIQRPEILAEPTGEIGFEWYKGKGFAFAFSVSGKNTITYAGIIGASKIHGSEYFSGDSLPRIILETINRLYNF